MNVLVKYKDVSVESKKVCTIKEHLKVLESYSSVFVAKFGRPLHPNKVKLLEEQIVHRIPTYLYLVSSKDDGFKLYRCNILNINNSKPHKMNFPEYYKNFEELLTTWFEVDSIVEVDNDLLSSMHVISTGNTALYSISKSMSSTLFLK